jgi:hypothetical protein
VLSRTWNLLCLWVDLAMRASVAEEGLPLSGAESLAWARFLRRSWRELEDFYWDKQHAAPQGARPSSPGFSAEAG